MGFLYAINCSGTQPIPELVLTCQGAWLIRSENGKDNTNIKLKHLSPAKGMHWLFQKISIGTKKMYWFDIWTFFLKFFYSVWRSILWVDTWRRFVYQWIMVLYIKQCFRKAKFLPPQVVHFQLFSSQEWNKSITRFFFLTVWFARVMCASNKAFAIFNFKYKRNLRCKNRANFNSTYIINYLTLAPFSSPPPSCSELCGM